MKIVFRVVASLLILVALFMCISVLVALSYGEYEVLNGFLIPIGVTLLIAIPYLIMTRGARTRLFVKDGFLMVALAWVSVSLLGAFPFWISGAIPSFVDCIFETMSGFSTTGASILADVEALPKSLLFWRSCTHWLGGMGIIVLAVAIFPVLGISGFHLFKAESPGLMVDKVSPKIASTAKILWIIYIGMTALETVLLMAGGLNLFEAVTHSFGTLATGGFSPRNGSVGAYESAFIQNIITIFMFLAGLNFVLFFKLLTGRIRTVFRDQELRSYVTIYLFASIFISGVLFFKGIYPTLGENFRHGFFQSAAILTTTGYSTVDFDIWPHVARAMLLILMFIGGCTGSTAGGIKVARVMTMMRQGWGEIRALLYPREMVRNSLFYSANPGIVRSIAGFIACYILIILITTLVVAGSGQDLITSLSTALATLGNIGPGFGGIGPVNNYGFYPDSIKIFLSFIMMMGRLELFTILVVLVPHYWRK